MRGRVLVVDAAQGIEAQTLANVYLALSRTSRSSRSSTRSTCRPRSPSVSGGDREGARDPAEEVILASAKEGRACRRSSRRSSRGSRRRGATRPRRSRALVFDSPLRPVQGRRRLREARAGHAPRARRHPADGHRARRPSCSRSATSARSSCPSSQLVAGEVGYVATGFKRVRDAQVGDTLTDARRPATEPLPGYQPAKSLVFAGLYPVASSDYPLLRDALEKLQLNDASFTYEPESSVALGFGFRCGFLGLLHMEIVQERLEREFDLDLLASAPSVEYEVTSRTGAATSRGRQSGAASRRRARSRRSPSPG